MTHPSIPLPPPGLPPPAAARPASGMSLGTQPPVHATPPRLRSAGVTEGDFLNVQVTVQDPATQPQPQAPTFWDRCDNYTCIPWRSFDPAPSTRYLVYWLPTLAAGAVATYGAAEGREDVATFGAVGAVAWLALSTTFGLLCWR